MADFISTYPGVDAQRLGAFGICGGGGYTLNAAKSDKRFKAVATLSMFNSGEVRRNGYINTGLDTIAKRMKEASDARAAEVTTGKISISGNVDFDALTDESIAKIPTSTAKAWSTTARPIVTPTPPSPTRPRASWI